ncbi:unnamed protein product [Periconia digitata]|uniref:Uncharacterized protein n=1 Tax=Periconia digitata TaxID=1303443 RepID=A0A9W4UHN4_9PLEO|nr:unnamed protein product [Periconia digitata]
MAALGLMHLLLLLTPFSLPYVLVDNYISMYLRGSNHFLPNYYSLLPIFFSAAWNSRNTILRIQTTTSPSNSPPTPN